MAMVSSAVFWINPLPIHRACVYVHVYMCIYACVRVVDDFIVG